MEESSELGICLQFQGAFLQSLWQRVWWEAGMTVER